MERSKELVEYVLNLSVKERVAFFNFDLEHDTDEEILLKFNLWARYFKYQFFFKEDGWFHAEIDKGNLESYRGTISSFADICFRLASKTSRTKLFIAFVILNDRNHFRRYIKILAYDEKSSTQFVTDIYNIFVDPLVVAHYPNTFMNTEFKREESRKAFDTSFGVKMLAGTVGQAQRGQIQDYSRPDWVIMDDFENRKTLRSAPITTAIWDNMEEARTGLAIGGSCIYLCNYISERGNVHRLVQKESEKNKVLIVPIKNAKGEPNWFHTKEELEQIEKDADDFAGEYMCEPSAGADIYFDREILKKQLAFAPTSPVKEISGFKIWKTYNPSSRYASGHDVSGGVGLDSSTSVFIDFDCIPCKVVATYKNNEIKPDDFGYEIINQAERYGECLVAPEKNNHGHATIAILKRESYPNIYFTEDKDTKTDIINKKQVLPKEYGWHTNTATKQKMMADLRKAVEKGLLDLTDPDIITEAISYSRDDLMDSSEIDPRMTTRHFDLLIATAIAWQMRFEAKFEDKQTEDEINEIRYKENDMSWEEKFRLI